MLLASGFLLWPLTTFAWPRLHEAPRVNPQKDVFGCFGKVDLLRVVPTVTNTPQYPAAHGRQPLPGNGPNDGEYAKQHARVTEGPRKY